MAALDPAGGKHRFSSRRQSQRGGDTMKAEADKVLKDAVSKGDVPGVTAAATDAKGTTYEAGFGNRVLGEAADMTPDTVAWIASMTKAITRTAPIHLVVPGNSRRESPAH